MKKGLIIFLIFIVSVIKTMAQGSLVNLTPYCFGVNAFFAQPEAWYSPDIPKHSPIFDNEFRQNNSSVSLTYFGIFVKKEIQNNIFISIGTGVGYENNDRIYYYIPDYRYSSPPPPPYNSIPYLMFISYHSQYLEFPLNASFKLNKNKYNSTYIGFGMINSFITHVLYSKNYFYNNPPVNGLYGYIQDSESRKIKYNRMVISATLGRESRVSKSKFKMFGALTVYFSPLIQKKNTEFTFTNYKFGLECGVSYSLR